MPECIFLIHDDANDDEIAWEPCRSSPKTDRRIYPVAEIHAGHVLYTGRSRCAL
jgi:hypothetical protein